MAKRKKKTKGQAMNYKALVQRQLKIKQHETLLIAEDALGCPGKVSSSCPIPVLTL